MARLDAALFRETANLSSTLNRAKARMECSGLHAQYLELKQALCCDFAYALTFLGVARLMSAFVLLPATLAAIAGYKRFPREVWGPYSSIQAREVGAYL